MAISARRCDVSAPQRESRLFMLEVCPPRKRSNLVALHTVGGEASKRVVGVLRSRKIISMATEAICGCPGVLFLRGVRVTGLAIQCCVFSEKRKTS